jgi:EpsD family peptidyl-prolyl cis-trans isomerase
MIRRTAAVVSIAMFLCSCGHKAEGQTVAVVNGEEITASELNSALQGMNLPSGVNKDEARSRMLQDLVERRLLVQEARKDGIDKSPDYVTEKRRLDDNLLVSLLVQRQLKTREVPGADEIGKFEASQPQMFANREIWSLQQLQYTTPKDPKVLKGIQDAHSLDDLAKVLSSNGIQFTRSSKKIDTAAFPKDTYQQIQSAPPGEPFVVSAGDRSAASAVISREPAALTGDSARALALKTMQQQDAQKLLKARLETAKKTAKIEYQPGFVPKK